MYKVLLVDDEDKIRLGLRKLVDWESMGFTVVGDVKNGNEALDFTRTVTVPDVILTDIRMPALNGISLIEEMSALHPKKIQFVLLSGYSQFSYAKKAIELGAFGYIIKPTKVSEIKEVFLRLHEKLKESEMNNLLLQQSKSFVKESIAKKLIDGQALEKDEAEDPLLLEWQTAWPDERHFSVIIVKSYGKHESVRPQLKIWLEQLTKGKMQFIDVMDKSDNLVVIMVGIDSAQQKYEQDVLNLCKQIIERSNKQSLSISIAAGDRQPGMTSLSLSYRNALFALKQTFFKGMNSVIEFSSISPHNRRLTYPSDYERQLIDLIQSGNKPQTMDTIERLFHREFSGDGIQPEQVHKICIELIVVISRHFQKHISERIFEVFDENRSFHLQLTEFELLEHLKTWMNQRLLTVIDVLLDLHDNTNSRVIRHIKQIIAQKYHEQITLQSISESLFMHADYISRLFKKEVGQTFIEYLTHFRIEKAKSLLLDISCKSYEVGYRVGYQNPNHFATIFKKVTGQSVTEFRKKLNLPLDE